eukprot:m.240458 g.240458  ORF g.240458 m.240458 type:complete len:1477 (-) comp15310_c0_seq2:141-4571(-)
MERQPLKRPTGSAEEFDEFVQEFEQLQQSGSVPLAAKVTRVTPEQLARLSGGKQATVSAEAESEAPSGKESSEKTEQLREQPEQSQEQPLPSGVSAVSLGSVVGGIRERPMKPTAARVMERTIHPALVTDALKQITARRVARGSTQHRPKGKSLFAAQFDKLHGRQTGSQSQSKQQMRQTRGAGDAQGTSTGTRSQRRPQGASGALSTGVLGDDLSLYVTAGDQEGNQAKIQGMTAREREDMLDEVKRLLSPEAIAFLRAKQKPKQESTQNGVDAARAVMDQDEDGEDQSEQTDKESEELSASTARGRSTQLVTDEGKEVPQDVLAKLPVKPDKSWVNMDVVEVEKLKWLLDSPKGELEAQAEAQAQLESQAQSQTKGRGAGKGQYTESQLEEDVALASGDKAALARQAIMNNQVRFGFEGQVLGNDVEFNPQSGLHHHAGDQSKAGYTLSDILELVRSRVTPQRVLGLQTIKAILDKAMRNEYLEGDAFAPNGSVILHAFIDLGLTLYLRKAMDESVMTVTVAAVEAMHSLLAYHDAVLQKAYRCTSKGYIMVQQRPRLTDAEVAAFEDASMNRPDPRNDADGQKFHIRQSSIDLVRTVASMDILPRLRYLLEVMELPAGVTAALGIVHRIAQHSNTLMHKVISCPRLIDTLQQRLVNPTADSFSSTAAFKAYSAATPMTLELFCTLSQGSKAFATQVFSTGLKHALMVHLASSVSVAQDAINNKEAAFYWLRACLKHGVGVPVFVDLFESITTQLRACVEHSAFGVASAILSCIAALAPLTATPTETLPPHAIHWPALHGMFLVVLDLGVDASKQCDAIDLQQSNQVCYLNALFYTIATCLAFYFKYTQALGAAPLASDGTQSSGLASSTSQGSQRSQGSAGLTGGTSSSLLESIEQAAAAFDGILQPCFDANLHLRLVELLTAQTTLLPSHTTTITFNPAILWDAHSCSSVAHSVLLADCMNSLVLLISTCVSVNKSLHTKLSPTLTEMRVKSPALFAAVSKAFNSCHRHALSSVGRVLHDAMVQLLRLLVDAPGVDSGVASGLTSTSNAISSQDLLSLFSATPRGCEDAAVWLFALVMTSVPHSDDVHARVSEATLSRVKVSLLQILNEGALQEEWVALARKHRTGDITGISSYFVGHVEYSDTHHRLPMAYDWFYWPLLTVLELIRLVPQGQLSEDHVSELAVDVAGSLSFINMMMATQRQYVDKVSKAKQLSMLLRVLVSRGRLYKEECVQKELAKGLLHLGSLGDDDVSQALVGTNAQTGLLIQIYVDAVEEFVTTAMGDDLVGRFLIKGFSTLFPLAIRFQAFSNERFAPLCRVQATDVPDTLATLFPLETDRQFLDMLIVHLHRETFTQSTFLYRYAIHHVAAFLFRDFGDYSIVASEAFEGDEHAEKHRCHALRRAVAAMADDTYNDMLHYTLDIASHSVVSFPIDIDEISPKAHATVSKRLEFVASLFEGPDRAVLAQRHPSLMQ